MASAGVTGNQWRPAPEISKRDRCRYRKVSNEVMAMLDMLSTEEQLAKKVLVSYSDLVILGYELIRYLTDLAIWKRDLASIFMGLAALPREFPLPRKMPSDTSSSEAIQSIISAFDEKSSMLSHHTIAFIHAHRSEDIDEATRQYITMSVVDKPFS